MFRERVRICAPQSEAKKIHVVVAISRHCQWKRTRIGRYLVLPKDGKANEDFGRRSQAFEQIVEGIRAVLKHIKAEHDAAPTSPLAKIRSGTTFKGPVRANAPAIRMSALAGAHAPTSQASITVPLL